MRDLLPALLLALVGTGALGTALAAPKAGATVLVVFPAGTAAEDAWMRVIAAGWRPISTPTAAVVLAAPDDPPARRPDGAWIVLDAMGLRGCT